MKTKIRDISSTFHSNDPDIQKAIQEAVPYVRYRKSDIDEALKAKQAVENWHTDALELNVIKLGIKTRRGIRVVSRR